jgi:hypothetical protein
MAGHGLSKSGVNALLARPSTSHFGETSKTWMPGIKPGMTKVDSI